jgi:hypothetical protein
VSSEDADPVREKNCLFETVSHEERRGTIRKLQPHEVLLEILSSDRIEGGEGLVQEEKSWVIPSRPGEGNPLALPSESSPGYAFHRSSRPTSRNA